MSSVAVVSDRAEAASVNGSEADEVPFFALRGGIAMSIADERAEGNGSTPPARRRGAGYNGDGACPVPFVTAVTGSAGEQAPRQLTANCGGAFSSGSQSVTFVVLVTPVTGASGAALEEEGRRLRSPSRGRSGCLRAGPTHADAVTCRSGNGRERFGPNREGCAPALIPPHGAAALVGPSADRTSITLHSERRWGSTVALVARLSHYIAESSTRRGCRGANHLVRKTALEAPLPGLALRRRPWARSA